MLVLQGMDCSGFNTPWTNFLFRVNALKGARESVQKVLNPHVNKGKEKNMDSYFWRVRKSTATRFWINNVTMKEADLAIEHGASGCTQNPSYVWKILSGSEDKDFAMEKLRGILKTESDPEAVVVRLQRDLVARVAEKFLPLYKQTQGQMGYVSIQGSPINEDTKTIVETARFNCIAPNIMAKIPVTEHGLEAIRILVKEGIPINATECMAVKQVVDVCEAYVQSIEGIAHPAPLYFSLITGIYDEYLQKEVASKNIHVDQDALWQAGMSIAKKVHQLVAARKYPCGFIGGGARGLHHFTEMVGADACITINWEGAAKELIEMNPPVVNRFAAPTDFSVEEELLNNLEDHRKAYFINGITSSEYEEFGPVVLFRNNFVSAWEKAIEFIRSLR